MLVEDVETRIAFAIHENKGVFALLLGSGLSRAAGIPTGWEITLDLVRRVATARGEAKQTDWAAWHRATIGGEPNYSTLLADLAASPDERRAILHGYIDPSEEDRENRSKRPTQAHLAIADMVRDGHIKVIVTTNFDRLLENALRERGVEPTVVASVDALKGAQPLTHSACYILKLHGDYKDSRILNTDEELSKYPAKFNRLLDRIFDEFGLIVAGWSGEWDHALRKALLRAPNRRYPTFWAVRGEIGDGAKELIAHRRATTVAIAGADAFFTKIGERVETLTQTRRRNPSSIDLLINSAKRYLAKPEHRIQLDNLATEETERLLKRLGDESFAVRNTCSDEDFRALVPQYDAAVEPLARLAGVLGRWGDGTEFALVVDVLKRLCAHGAVIENGATVLNNLKTYPAVLIFTGYGLGLTRAERWRDLHGLFSAFIAYNQYHDQKRAVDHLFLAAWEGGRGYWNKLEGMSQHKTPLSDHLADLFQNWSRSFCGLTADFELLFAKFELLGSLAYLEQFELETIQQWKNPLKSDDEWMPVGRVGWDGDGKTRLVNDLNYPTTQTALLSASFAKGDGAFLKRFIEIIQQIQLK